MNFLTFIFALFLTTQVHALQIHGSLGFHKMDEDVQDVNGEDVSDPFNPMISIGTTFPLYFSRALFSPQFAYISNDTETDDSYGGELKMRTFVLIYDWVWPLQGSIEGFGIRFGMANFIKKIEGEGGTVEVPNGESGTITAYKPAEAQTSYSTTFNIGIDYNLKLGSFIIPMLGARLESFIFGAFNGDKRTPSYQFSIVTYF